MADIEALVNELRHKRFNELDSQTIAQFQRPEVLSFFLNKLSSDDYDARTLGWYGLVAAGKPAIPGVLQILKEGTWSSRLKAAETLGAIRDPSVIPDLITALKDDDDYQVRGAAVRALGRLHALAAVPKLIEMMLDPERELFSDAVDALRDMAEERDISELHPLLHHPDQLVRTGAVFVLGEKAGVDGIQGFIDLLRDGLFDRHDHDVKKAIKWLVNIGKDAVPAVSELLHDPDEEVRRDAAHVLSRIGDVSALPALVAAMNDEDEMVRCDAISGLGNLGEAALPVLLKLIDSEEYSIRWCAMWGLTWMGIPALEDLVRLLGQENEAKRRSAASAFHLMYSTARIPEALDRLIAALEDENQNIQKGAAEELSSSFYNVAKAQAAVEEWRRKQQNQ